jgi:hypothetical protein
VAGRTNSLNDRQQNSKREQPLAVF